MVFYDFGVKYSEKDRALHLKDVLGKKRGNHRLVSKLYIGIALKWDNEKGAVQLLMPEYVRASLHYFQHEK